MKAELRLAAHHVLPGVTIVEVWFEGAFIAEITGADGPGVRIISKYALEAHVVDPRAPVVIEVTIVDR